MQRFESVHSVVDNIKLKALDKTSIVVNFIYLYYARLKIGI